MTATRLKLGAQVLAVGLVALLLALLVWKLAHGSGKKARVGGEAPNFTLNRIDKPGSLQDDEVYARTAYLLAANELIAADAVVDATSLPKVKMPARVHFVPDTRGNPKPTKK